MIDQLVSNAEILEGWILSGCFQFVFGVIQGVVGYEVVLNVVYSDSHRLLQQAVLLELVGINQRANQAAVGILLGRVFFLKARCLW